MNIKLIQLNSIYSLVWSLFLQFLLVVLNLNIASNIIVSDKHWTSRYRSTDELYRCSLIFKGTWIGFSMRNIDNQAIMHCIFMDSQVLGQPEIVKLLLLVSEQLRKWNFQKVTDITSDGSSRKFTKYHNIMYAKNHLERQGLTQKVSCLAKHH